MAVNYDPTSNVGKVRLLSGDRPNTDGEAVLEDADITTILTLRDDNVFLAAATALRSIAADTALRDKVIRLQDIETDGASLARELRQQAEVLEQQADEEFDLGWAPMVTSDHAWRERMWNERLRDG